MNHTSGIRLLPAALALAITAALAPLAASATPPAKSAAAPRAAAVPDMAYTREVLPNGLTLIVHEDHKAPIVNVSVWYHIGSGDEPQGKTGFAHLFEHLMFSGSENHRDSYFRPFELAGSSNLNGTTWLDRTNYFETVPTTALDMTLWMESDRMGHLLGAIGKKEIDIQRGVVQNEKRQRENRPYGRSSENIQKSIYPANHPYHHTTIGSLADLDAASLDDVKQWFRSNYGAANTTLVLAGDVTPAVAREKVMKYFGDIAAGQPVAHQQPWVTPLPKQVNAVLHDHVAQTRIYRTWVAPQLGSDDAIALSLATNILGSGKSSRLYQRLVFKDKLADGASSTLMPFALASQLQIQANVKQGVEPAKVDAAIDDELQRFLKNGPSEDELARAKMGYRAMFIRALESVDVQASVLAEGQVYRGNPGAYKKDLSRTEAMTAAQVKAAAARWFGKGDYHLTMMPGAKDFDPAAEDAKVVPRAALAGKPEAKLPPAATYSVARSDVDRGAGVPAVTTFPKLQFPAVQHARLKNGVEVVLAERHTIPVTQVQLVFDGGYAADQGRKAGTATFTTRMLTESTQRHDSTEIDKRKDRLGASIESGCDLDSCEVSLDTLNDQLRPSLELLADSVRRPAFNAADIERIRGTRLSALAQSRTSPNGITSRVLPGLVYGKNHPYGNPFDGLGVEADLKSMSQADFTGFARDWLRPDNMRILVVGDTTLADIVPKLEEAFGDWQAPASPLPKKSLPVVDVQKTPRIFLVDRPDAPQSMIMAGVLASPSTAPDQLALGMANDAMGGSFTSRLNMNLREDKHWSYGAGSFIDSALGQRMMYFYAPVQTDKTAESIGEMAKELRAVVGDKPLTGDEIAKIKANNTRVLPGRYETASNVMRTLGENVRFGRPDDEMQTVEARTEAVTPAQAQAALNNVIATQEPTWVIVGDLKKIEQPVRALGMGTVSIIDADGNPR